MKTEKTVKKPVNGKAGECRGADGQTCAGRALPLFSGRKELPQQLLKTGNQKADQPDRMIQPVRISRQQIKGESRQNRIQCIIRSSSGHGLFSFPFLTESGKPAESIPLRIPDGSLLPSIF